MESCTQIPHPAACDALEPRRNVWRSGRAVFYDVLGLFLITMREGVATAVNIASALLVLWLLRERVAHGMPLLLPLVHLLLHLAHFHTRILGYSDHVPSTINNLKLETALLSVCVARVHFCIP